VNRFIGVVLLSCTLKQIQWAGDLTEGFTAYVQIDHGGGQSPVAQQHLNSTDIIACFQKMGSKAMPVMPNSA